jgi:protein-disulfide isomerase
MAARRKANTLEKLVPILLLASIVLAFVVGVLWQKVSSLEGGGVRTAGTSTQTAGSGTTSPSAPTTQGKLSEDQVKNIPEVTDADHIRGSLSADVFLIEYSDLECPFCLRFHPTAQQVVDEYGGKVAWVYRHFPLDQIHSKARPAALASECVAEIGGEDAFWAFIDEIFSDQSSLSDLSAVASKVGVSGGSYESCVDGKKYADKVQEQYDGGVQSGVRGTPGNFIVNKKGEAWTIPGAVPFETLKVTIDEALGS